MPATPVKIGPFSGGLNSYSGPTSIGDNEVIDIQNFDIDYDGSLYTRAPITVVDNGETIPGTGALMPLGWFIDLDGTRYLFMSSADSTYARNETTGVWITVSSDFAATAMCQYANKAYVIADPNELDPGGYWTSGGGFIPIPAMPKGTSICIYKERLFIAGSLTNPNRVFFSNPADFAVFQTTINFFDVRSGDGQDVIAAVTFQDTVVIFKDDSTYVYSYDSNPSRGTVRLINGAVGLTNKYCIVEYENSLYLHYNDSLYQVSNWNFTMVNVKVPFEYIIKFDIGLYGASRFPTLSILSDRLIVHHFDAIYVFNLRMGVWTKWAVAESHLFNRFIEVPRPSPDYPERYYGGCRRGTTAASNRALYEWRPIIDVVRSEPIQCHVLTKTYDFNVPYTFKRLFWWGVDMLSKGDVTFTVHPVAYSPGVTHRQMAQYTHAEIIGNHLRPLLISIDVTSSKQISNTTGDRLFIKLIKSMRFRQIFFSLSSSVNGSTTEGPLRIYSIVAFIDNKQLVSKELS